MNWRAPLHYWGSGGRKSVTWPESWEGQNIPMEGGLGASSKTISETGLLWVSYGMCLSTKGTTEIIKGTHVALILCQALFQVFLIC